MIAYLKGSVVERGENSLVLESGGIGYEVFVAPSSLRRLDGTGDASAVELFISESTAMYGGGTTLYGFFSREEKEIFLCLREHVPSTGAKKALEHLDKAARSLPEFRRAILEGDSRILAGVFGFTQKTAERLIGSLKDKLGERQPSGRGAGRPFASSGRGEGRAMQTALDALIALGYKPAESRQALDACAQELSGKEGAEDIIRAALRRL